MGIRTGRLGMLENPYVRTMPRILQGPLDSLFSTKGFVLGCMVLCVLASAMMVVTTKHLNRKLHIDLQDLQQKRDKLHIEYSQLLLEQGTLGSDARVEQVAREQLGMNLPKPEQTWVIKP